ncbi:MAG: MetQ/NlpA family ABC transporter substrate-binding protein [Defluviitaleaceae bacterium]|nr:MetQ/NlpA family ABC transporter substrate-binding protein [Defluviitaleaceae bacterium]
MKKGFGLAAVLVIGFMLAACGNESANGDMTVVTIGVVGAVQDQWAAVNAQLYDEGIQVDLVFLNEWTMPNPALNDGELDLNAFQNRVFLENAMHTNGYELAIVGETFIAPQNIFNGRADIPADHTRTSLVDEVEDGFLVGIPNDLTNGGRALKLLEAAGLIDIDPEVGFLATEADIINFHVDIEIRAVEANTLPTLLPDFDIAVINNPQAMIHGLSANNESIFREDALNIEVAPNLINLIVARAGEENNPIFQRILEAYQTQAVIDVFENEFDGAFVPAW